MNTKPKSLAATLFLATGLAVSAQAQPAAALESIGQVADGLGWRWITQ